MVKGTLRSILVWSRSCDTQSVLSTWWSRTHTSFPSISFSLVIRMIYCASKSWFGVLFHCHPRRWCSTSNRIDTQVEAKIVSKGYLRETSNNCTMSLTFQKYSRIRSKAGQDFFLFPIRQKSGLKITAGQVYRIRQTAYVQVRKNKTTVTKH